MTKNEKIAITSCAVVGFVAFCVLLVPICITLAIALGETTCVIGVDYDKLPYAMGEDYVFISPQFFDDNKILQNTDSNVMYTGRYSEYGDGVFDKPIRKSHNYNLSFFCGPLDGKDAVMTFNCNKTYDGVDEDYTEVYGKYKYGITTRKESYTGGLENFELIYLTRAFADSGNICDIHVRFCIYNIGDSDELSQYQAQCTALFESMLDNLVGYSQAKSLT